MKTKTTKYIAIALGVLCLALIAALCVQLSRVRTLKNEKMEQHRELLGSMSEIQTAANTVDRPLDVFRGLTEAGFSEVGVLRVPEDGQENLGYVLTVTEDGPITSYYVYGNPAVFEGQNGWSDTLARTPMFNEWEIGGTALCAVKAVVRLGGGEDDVWLYCAPERSNDLTHESWLIRASDSVPYTEENMYTLTSPVTFREGEDLDGRELPAGEQCSIMSVEDGVYTVATPYVDYFRVTADGFDYPDPGTHPPFEP